MNNKEIAYRKALLRLQGTYIVLRYDRKPILALKQLVCLIQELIKAGIVDATCRGYMPTWAATWLFKGLRLREV